MQMNLSPREDGECRGGGRAVICVCVAVGGEMAFIALGKKLFLSLVVVISIVLYRFPERCATNK